MLESAMLFDLPNDDAPYDALVARSGDYEGFAETRACGDIAREMQNLQKMRAVGRANGANELGIVVPCHRLIGADGSLTGYGDGLWRKQWLLRHEAKMWPGGLLRRSNDESD